MSPQAPSASTMTAAMPHMAPAAHAPHAPANDTGLDTSLFIKNNKIHVQDGSYFISPYLVLHPRELDPANEPALRKKLELTFSLNHPPINEKPKRKAFIDALATLIPVSPTAEHKQLTATVERYNQKLQNGIDPATQQPIADKHAPLQALLRQETKHDISPTAADKLSHGVALYLLIRKKIEQNGFGQVLMKNSETNNPQTNQPESLTADQALASVASYLGVTPLQIREAAAKGGVHAVGALLGFDKTYITQVEQVVAHAQAHEFSNNVIENWFHGQQQPGELPDKLAAGLQARIAKKIPEYRAKAEGRYEAPEAIKKTEQQVADNLHLVAPIQLKLMQALGYEICYTPDTYSDKISFGNNLWGMHRATRDNPTDTRGAFRIYYSYRGNTEDSMCTFVHEVAHNFWPQQFTPEEITAIDHLLQTNTAHVEKLYTFFFDTNRDHGLTPFDQLVKLHSAYKAGNPQEKAAVIQAANTLFAPMGLQVDHLFPHLTDPNRMKFMVERAYNDLRIEGGRYQRSTSYTDAPSRLREIISRFAELKQVRLRGEPELLNFIAPDMNMIFDRYYLGHLERVVSKLPQHAPISAQHIGHLPANVTQVHVPANDTAPQADTHAQACGGCGSCGPKPTVTGPVTIHATAASPAAAASVAY